MTDLNHAALVELAEVKGQLKLIVTMLQQQHSATNQRIDDMRSSMENRFEGVEDRLGTLETNERSTALRTAGISAISAAAVSAMVAAGAQLMRMKG